MSRRFKVAFIGTGGRSVVYGRTYADCPDIEVVALADPSARNRKTMIAKSRLANQPAEYDNWPELLAKHADLDGVVIATPNNVHADPAVACLERGLTIALEKPLAATPAECDRIIAAEKASGARTLIGFVLRSSPLYQKIREIVLGGSIGELVSIQADELVSFGVSSVMIRSPWRRFDASSGGALLEKCCHDIDIVNWMTSSRPASLNSFGRRAIFGPDPTLPRFCEGCRLADSCKYYLKPVFSERENPDEQTLHEFIQEQGRCIYNLEKEGVDVQSVQLEYESGVVANFMMNFNCMGPRADRNFHAVGTKGRVWASVYDRKVWLYENGSGRTTEFDASGDGSGHGGGDRLHALLLREMMLDPSFRPACDASAGYLSAVTCFAADVSRLERRRVALRYDAEGRVSVL